MGKLWWDGPLKFSTLSIWRHRMGQKMCLGVLSRTKLVIYYLRSQDLSHVLGSPRSSLLLCKMVTSSPHSGLQGLQGCDRFEWFGKLQCSEQACVALGRKITVCVRFILFNFIHFCDRIFGSGDAEKEKEGLFKFLFFMKKKLYFFCFCFWYRIQTLLNICKTSTENSQIPFTPLPQNVNILFAWSLCLCYILGFCFSVVTDKSPFTARY